MRRRFTTNKGLTKTFDVNNYLTIEALEDNLTLIFTHDIEYGIDGKGWIKLKSGYKTQTINIGQTLSFKGNLTPNSRSGIGTFTISKKCNLKGNIMSLLYGDDFIEQIDLTGKDYAFCCLFSDCTTIVDVSKLLLPATKLAEYCYSDMFRGCSSLTTAPALPTTTLASGCYSHMFYGCTSLTTAPELPATTLANNCYEYMFRDCKSLTVAPELPATTLAAECYYNMFNGCNSLTTAPELPATTLASSCYSFMFYGCTSLTTAPALPTTTLASGCYKYMFNGCKSLTTAPELPATKLAYNCYEFMFSNCTNLTTAPALPATKLANYCYQSMFYGCSKLNYIKMLATDISASNCLYYWVNGVASSGTFVKNVAMTSLPTAASNNSYYGIPKGWTVEDYNPSGGGE